MTDQPKSLALEWWHDENKKAQAIFASKEPPPFWPVCAECFATCKSGKCKKHQNAAIIDGNQF